MRLIGRDEVYAQLDALLGAGTPRSAGVVLIEGAVGCGRTEMLAHVAETAARGGALVLRGAGSAHDRDLPYGVLRQLTAGLPADIVPAARQGELSGAEFTRALCVAAERGPVVVCVDDLHLIDAASLEGLLEVARTVRTAPVLLVLADMAQEHVGSPLARTEFLRHPGFTRVALGRLDTAGTAELATLLTGAPTDPTTTAALHAATGGNPLLLRALLSERTPMQMPAAAAREATTAPAAATTPATPPPDAAAATAAVPGTGAPLTAA
ncbi:ATP-binding protein, partial [Streptomyces bambusae]